MLSARMKISSRTHRRRDDRRRQNSEEDLSRRSLVGYASQFNCGLSDVGKQTGPGTLMKRISKSTYKRMIGHELCSYHN